MAKAKSDWMEVDGRRFIQELATWWIAEGEPEIYVYEVSYRLYRGGPRHTYWEASRSRQAPREDILVTKSKDLEECCWDAVQALKGSLDEQLPTWQNGNAPVL